MILILHPISCFFHPLTTNICPNKPNVMQHRINDTIKNGIPAIAPIMGIENKRTSPITPSINATTVKLVVDAHPLYLEPIVPIL